MIDKIKDPDEDLDYTWDFDEVILEEGAEIATYSFPGLPDELTLHDPSNGGRAITAFVSPGGTEGETYVVTCQIITNSATPRTYERSIRFVMKTL